MNRTILIPAFIVFLTATAFSAPDISAVEVSPPDPALGTVRVTYSLSNPPAIVTAELFENGVPLPDEAHTYLDGDVNRYVTNTTCSFTWDPRHAWPEHRMNGTLSVRVTAHTLADPPLYCVVDLSHGSEGDSFPLEFYTSSNAVPDGVTAECYKRQKLILRKIPCTGAEGFLMGAPDFEGSRDTVREKQHRVILTRDFYMGVFEVTQEQFRRVYGEQILGGKFQAIHTENAPANYTSMNPVLPMDTNNFAMIRGSVADGIDWPSTGYTVKDSTFMDILRRKTGNLLLFDLPTDAQWEYAARAGNMGSYPSGDLWMYTQADGESWNDVIERGNSNYVGKISSFVNFHGCHIGHPLPVGSLRPNAWGLYDVCGNIYERVLDWVDRQNSLTNAVDPVGADTEHVYRIFRGGAYNYNLADIRIPRRSAESPDRCTGYIGFRIAATIVE
ncbi:MAG: formylglycine-generating enzyme family protein [Kiritimatiellae bacterium]|nr:formylglycine-generating enzyme family protein [Kiritimatiellia bacterium]